MKKKLLFFILIITARCFAWEAHDPVVQVSDSLYTFEHSFLSELPFDTLVSVLYSKEHIINLNNSRNTKVTIPEEGEGWYDVQALYSYLWFYKNRIVMRREIKNDGQVIYSKLIEFWQTFGIAPEPTSSIAEFYLTPYEGWTEVTFIQKTTFESGLGKLAKKVFIQATINYLIDVERYVCKIERNMNDNTKLLVSSENKLLSDN